MKKVFAILLVLAVVAGYIFATDTETHSLTVKTVVEGYLPVFQLAYSAAEGDGAYASSDTAATNTGKSVVFDNAPDPTTYTASYTGTDSNDLRVLDISQNDVQIAFAMNLLNADKRIQKKTYNVVFTVGAFAVYRSGVAGVHGADTVSFNATEGISYVEWTAPTVSIDSSTEIATATTSVTFKGNANEAEGTTTKTLGKLNVHFPVDNSIDPNANTDKTDGYTTDITMHITAN